MELSTLQTQVNTLEIERDYIKGTVLQKSLLFGEEVGELFKAIREREGMSVHSKSMKYSVEDELSDCLFLLAAIANRYGISLEEAFKEKMKKDELKVYQKVV